MRKNFKGWQPRAPPRRCGERITGGGDRGAQKALPGHGRAVRARERVGAASGSQSTGLMQDQSVSERGMHRRVPLKANTIVGMRVEQP